jgi:hypothetical protein
MTGAYYGVVFAVLMFVLGRWAPQPAGSIVLWSLLSAHVAFTLWIMWYRLRLPWYSAGCVAALLASLTMIPVSARGLDLATMVTELPLPIVVAIWSAILFVPLAIGLESLRDSPEWRALSEQTKRASLWEMIRFRHVPQIDRKSDR